MIKNDRIWPLWNNGGNSFKLHAEFFNISVYHTNGKWQTHDTTNPRGGDTGRFSRMQIVTVG